MDIDVNDFTTCEELLNSLKTVSAQYNAVVKQNKSLQETVLWQKDQMQKDNDYLIKLEETNMLHEQDIEILKRQVESLQAQVKEYKKTIHRVNSLTEKELK